MATNYTSMQNFMDSVKNGTYNSVYKNSLMPIMAPSLVPAANPANLNGAPEADEFVSSKPGKKKPDKKLLIALGVAVAALGSLAYVLFRKRPPANFSEHIDFVKASTMDEAREFASKNFGVKTFDFGDDLEFANWVNEGLANVNNRFKGKAHMPKTLGFLQSDKNLTKEVSGNTGNTCAVTYGLLNEIRFNPKTFDRDYLYGEIMSFGDKFFSYNENGKISANFPRLASVKRIKELGHIWDKLKKDPNALSRFEMASAVCKIEDCMSSYMDPKRTLYTILDDEKIMAALKQKGLEINVEEFLKLAKNEQIDFLCDICKKAKIWLVGSSSRSNSVFDTMYHEMGHLEQHASSNLFDILFGKLSKSKRRINKFLNNRQEQKIAGKVSWYAKSEPQEFVAETFNALMAGKKFPDEVMELYKKYGGPILPNM